MKVCVQCGIKGYSEEFIPGPIPGLMQREGYCFSCAFWYVLAEENSTNPYWVRIDGVSYIAEGTLQPGQKAKREWGKGFGGTEFEVKTDDGFTFRTDSLWYQGKMPGWFAQKWPNNAVFLKGR